MSKFFFLIVGISVGLSIAATPAQATLIGDTVELNRFENGALAAGPFSAIVAAGPVEFNEAINQPFTVDIDASSIVIQAGGPVSPITFGIGVTNILEISSLDWVGMSGFISGVSVVADSIVVNQAPLSFSDRVTFTDHSISVNVEGTQWGTGFAQPVGTLTINLQTAHIPEPSTAAFGLFAIGAVSTVLGRRSA